MLNLNFTLPKTIIHLDKKVYEADTNINGKIEIKGGLKNYRVKRYDIDLIETNDTSLQEKTVNSHTVLFSFTNLPNKSEMIPFSFYIPGNINCHGPKTSSYTLVIRVVFRNSKKVIQKFPVAISNENV